MAATPNRKLVTYRRISPPGAGNYEVRYEGVPIGTVGRFRLAAGQFGSHWVATTPRRQRSGRFTTRDAAAKWLIGQVRGGGRS